MAKHIFDVHKSETRQLVAGQLREIADELAEGSLDLAYEEQHEPTEVSEPVDITVDLTKGRHRMDLVIHLSWPLAGHEPG
jgi:amphi-Trp domain-containing protein